MNERKKSQDDAKVFEQIFFYRGRQYFVESLPGGLWSWQSRRGPNNVMSLAIPFSVITGQPMRFVTKRGAVRHAYHTAYDKHGRARNLFRVPANTQGLQGSDGS